MLGVVNDKKYFRDSTAWDRRILHQCVRPWREQASSEKELGSLGSVLRGTRIARDGNSLF